MIKNCFKRFMKVVIEPFTSVNKLIEKLRDEGIRIGSKLENQLRYGRIGSCEQDEYNLVIATPDQLGFITPPTLSEILEKVEKEDLGVKPVPLIMCLFARMQYHGGEKEFYYFAVDASFNLMELDPVLSLINDKTGEWIRSHYAGEKKKFRLDDEFIFLEG
jgi:hypothetical protein